MSEHKIYLHNTATRKKEEFTPQDPHHVTIYYCGPTVYDYVHIGNAFSAVVFDQWARLLKYIYGTDHVVYARNITDIDDKINNKAKQINGNIEVISSKYTIAYAEDCAALHCLVPDAQPFATKYIPQMIEMIESIIKAGNAYEAEGHVLFHVPSKADYGKLSGRNRDDMIAGARVDVAPYKKDPADFVLWKPSTPDLPGWDSPWGRGRPGWHIECSAMTAAHLGKTLDIHGGGQDLIFPHHENEIAQSECAHGGTPFVRYWLHNGFITVEGEKMSKSLGNFTVLRDVLADHHGEVVRFALLSGHYRQQLDWSARLLSQAKAVLDKFYNMLLNNPDVQIDAEAPMPAAFLDALCDDLNMPQAMAVLHQLFSEISSASNEKEKQNKISSFVKAAHMIGVLQEAPQDWFRWQPKGKEGLADAEIERLIAERNTARAAKDFQKADAIRDQLQAANIQLEDADGRTIWKRA